MKTIIERGELERKLFAALKESFPEMDIFGHTVVLHTDKWWTCYVFARQEEVSQENFRRVIRRAKLFFRTSSISVCYPRNQASGTDTQKRHFFNVWLPVLPARTAGDFAKFNPTFTP